MKIGIQTWGSDGDILPFFALAHGLKKAGHAVTVAYTSVDKKDYSTIANMINIEAFHVFEHFESNVESVFRKAVYLKKSGKRIVPIYGSLL